MGMNKTQATRLAFTKEMKVQQTLIAQHKRQTTGQTKSLFTIQNVSILLSLAGLVGASFMTYNTIWNKLKVAESEEENVPLTAEEAKEQLNDLYQKTKCAREEAYKTYKKTALEHKQLKLMKKTPMMRWVWYQFPSVVIHSPKTL